MTLSSGNTRRRTGKDWRAKRTVFDTVCLSQPMHPRLSDRELIMMGARKPKGRTAYVINPEAGNPAAGETMPALTWQTQLNGIQYLSARFSLPRQRWGHNARLPASAVDLFADLGMAADAIYKATGLVFNPLTANVTDVHYAMDFHVGTERLRPILEQLETRQLPRHRRIRFDYGVEFKQRQAAVQVYSKFVEVSMQIEKGHIAPEHHPDALQAADGALRVEARLSLPSVERSQARQGLTRKASDVLTPEASYRVITEVLDKLQFTDAVNNARTDQGLDRLIQYHGVTVAIRLCGFLQMIKSYGVDFWRVMPYARRTYYDNLRLCKDAGVLTVEK